MTMVPNPSFRFLTRKQDDDTGKRCDPQQSGAVEYKGNPKQHFHKELGKMR